ncbi:MAG: 1-deoxy-D-xylulose-5-phosphate synthase [Eubacteriales bacterium SKADARSKE-1]|nr:1-deoxy-D-xylulose-5-phosphate synthase [Eubacteriales bacterium SKADARSKE-1]
MSKEILGRMNSPKDLKKLSLSELDTLCEEIREKIIDTVSKNGGHLASNLGVVELTVALHRVFNCPEDYIVWDVGHQCYAHKILTGRLDKLNTIRQENGISGFPRRNESAYDTFSTGHSSTSISSAYGIARAKNILEEDAKVVAIIGDGALSGGLAYEGLNNAGSYRKNFIVILNDNKMSISRNVGSMARYLSAMRTRRTYLKFKNMVANFLDRLPFLGNFTKKVITWSTSALKHLLYNGNIFESMGFIYYGPIDGHNVKKLINVLNFVKKVDRPVLVHINTIKGKGYSFAEKNPKVFHGISSFDIKTGGQKISNGDFSSVFGRKLCQMAQKDEKICAITAAMKLGTGLLPFSKNFKNRFFDVGIAEEHAVTFAGGLAAGGVIPVFAVYSTFLQRSYDQIIHDAALQRLKVVLAIDRAGVVGEDGETHQGVFDTAFLNSIPGVTIFSPSYFNELETMLESAMYSCPGVCAVRYPRGAQPLNLKDFKSTGKDFDIYGKVDSDILIVTYGRIFSNACIARESLQAKGINACILKLNKIKPIDENAIKFAAKFSNVFFFEEGILNGGIGEHFNYKLSKSNFCGKFNLTAIDDKFVAQATVKATLENLYLDEKGMENIILRSVLKIGDKKETRCATV